MEFLRKMDKKAMADDTTGMSYADQFCMTSCGPIDWVFSLYNDTSVPTD